MLGGRGTCFRREILPSRRTILPSTGGRPIFEQNLKDTRGPGRARIRPAGIFSTSVVFFQRSGEYFPARRLRGGRASGAPLGAFAEVGRRICLREASRRSGMHRKQTLEAENPPFRAGVGQIQSRQGFSRPPLILRVQISAQHESA